MALYCIHPQTGPIYFYIDIIYTYIYISSPINNGNIITANRQHTIDQPIFNHTYKYYTYIFLLITLILLQIKCIRMESKRYVLKATMPFMILRKIIIIIIIIVISRSKDWKSRLGFCGLSDAMDGGRQHQKSTIITSYI